MEGLLIFNIGGVERKFHYGLYAFGKTLKHFGYSVSDIGDPDISVTVDDIEFFAVFTFHAASAIKIRDEQPIDFNLMHVYEWIDQTGGIIGEFMPLGVKTMNASMRLSMSVPDGPLQEPETEEKKSKPKSPKK